MSLSLSIGSSQDVQVLLHGDRYPVTPGPDLRASRWVGGTFVQFVLPTGVDDWLVEKSAGVFADGFLMWASANRFDSVGDAGYRNWTSYQNDDDSLASVASGAATTTMIAGGGRYLFRVFETIALDPAGVRAGGPAVYTLNDTLKVSENGLLCNDPDAELLLATGGTEVVAVGVCCVVPSPRSAGRLGIDLKF